VDGEFIALAVILEPFSLAHWPSIISRKADAGDPDRRLEAG
jgi:hypothetical protein